MALSKIQEDCVSFQGDCSKCLHHRDSFECKVKYTKGVAPLLNLEPEVNVTYQCETRGEDKRKTPGQKPWLKDLDRGEGTCQYCAKTFKKASSHQKYCAPCAQGDRAATLEKKCLVCNAIFLGRRSSSYCSRRCIEIVRNEAAERSERYRALKKRIRGNYFYKTFTSLESEGL